MEAALDGRGRLVPVWAETVGGNEYLYTYVEGDHDASLGYLDNDVRPAPSDCYCVRVQQADEQTAWLSPIWVTYRG